MGSRIPATERRLHLTFASEGIHCIPFIALSQTVVSSLLGSYLFVWFEVRSTALPPWFLTSMQTPASHLSLSHPIPSHPIPSHPIPSHPIPSHPEADFPFPLPLVAHATPKLKEPRAWVGWSVELRHVLTPKPTAGREGKSHQGKGRMVCVGQNVSKSAERPKPSGEELDEGTQERERQSGRRKCSLLMQMLLPSVAC
ncbi:hypothetical protein B0T10DRAFT_262817 [Thelonectria olida]|uniref:Uncharacterized protein n=1 Tax=Thelonectria olida TaxID=1576542 RepID=A0A9P9ASL2_9HYPO|nr:hypothetical protein B0T10DRAFT_262817 [Thelonectria olida]